MKQRFLEYGVPCLMICHTKLIKHLTFFYTARCAPPVSPVLAQHRVKASQGGGELVWDLVLGNLYGLMVLNFLFLFFLLRCSVLGDFRKHFPLLL